MMHKKNINRIIVKQRLAVLGFILLGFLAFFIISQIDRYITLDNINKEKTDSTNVQSVYKKIQSKEGLTDEEMKKLILKKLMAK